jgi:hypothetical protein
MTLREQLLKEQSRENCLKIVEWVGNSPRRFAALFHLFMNDEYRVIQRASWAISIIAETYPVLIRKHLPEMLEQLSKPGLPEAAKRNTIRILQFMDIPEEHQGEVMNACFDYLISPTEKPAVKAFSLTVLERLSVLYPEIKPELKTIIESQMDQESPAFRSRAGKIIKKL